MSNKRIEKKRQRREANKRDKFLKRFINPGKRFNYFLIAKPAPVILGDSVANGVGTNEYMNYGELTCRESEMVAKASKQFMTNNKQTEIGPVFRADNQNKSIDHYVIQGSVDGSSKLYKNGHIVEESEENKSED